VEVWFLVFLIWEQNRGYDFTIHLARCPMRRDFDRLHRRKNSWAAREPSLFFFSLRRTDLQNKHKPPVLSMEIFFLFPGDDIDCGCLRELLKWILEGKRAVTADWEIIIYKTEIRNV